MYDQKEGALRGSKSGMALMAMRQNLIVTQILSEFFFALEILESWHWTNRGMDLPFLLILPHYHQGHATLKRDMQL